MHTVLLAGFALVSLSLFLVAGATLWWMLHAWRTPATLHSTGFRGEASPQLSFSLIVPARHEETVLYDTLARLAHMDHPCFEVIAVVGHDDDATRAVAERAARTFPDTVRVVVDESWPKTKPRGLNSALPHCRGDVVGVFDAEDEIDVRLLRRIDAAFTTTGADVVQGGVQLINFRSSWWSLRNCLEYFFWFRSRLHLHAQHGFIPLGGNTVFVRSDVLRDAGGWDGECLAEDCELGVRLSSRGARVVVAYDPDLVTREETPPTIGALFRQRTRWNQGFLQVLRKGEWRRLPTRRQRWLARYTLAMPFLQALAGVLVPISIATMLWAKVPVALAFLSFLPAIPTLMVLFFELTALRDFCRMYFVRVRVGDYVRLVLGMFPYQLLLATASVRAAVRETFGLRGWEKTPHVGAHRRAADLAAELAPEQVGA